MKNRLWILLLIGISFTGCYTSFAPRDYEEEAYGNLEDAYYDSDEYVPTYDTLDYVDEQYLYDNPQDITIVNNYAPDYGWGYYSPVYVTGRYNYWDSYYSPYYDPYCDPFYTPYYRPFYSSYIYWDSYYGPYYSNNNYFPSETRYRNKRHWTNLRNNGGRTTVARSRNTNGVSRGELTKRNPDLREVRGFDLDRELRVTRSSGTTSATGSITRNNGIRTASIKKNGEVKTARKKTTDLERRRISTKLYKGELTKSKTAKRNSYTQSHEKRKVILKKDYTNYNSKNRSKRVYSSKRKTSSNVNTATRSYHRTTPKSSNRSSRVSQSARNNGSSKVYSNSKSSHRRTTSSSSSYKKPSNSNRSSSIRRSPSPSRSSSVGSSSHSSTQSRSSSKSSSRGRR